MTRQKGLALITVKSVFAFCTNIDILALTFLLRIAHLSNTFTLFAFIIHISLDYQLPVVKELIDKGHYGISRLTVIG